MVVETKNELILRINLDEPGLVESILTDGGIMTKKNITFDHFVKMMIKSSVNVFSYEHAIPKNCYRVFGVDNTYGVLVSVPKHTAPALLKSNVEDNAYIVPYPNLLFKFVFNEKTKYLIEGCCYAYKDAVINSSTELFLFPYSNVSKSGSICFGGNQIKITDLKEGVKQCEEVFFSTPYNGDYYGLDRTGLLCETLKSLFEKVNNLDEFPEEHLVSLNKTVADLKL